MHYKKADWIHNTTIYEVNLRQYSAEGTFDAFTKELPRLKDMGVEILWFMPITPISLMKMKGSMGSYYACSDYLSVNPEFGTMEDFIALIKQAHKMGFKIIMDWVANHTGWDHVWTSEHPDYYLRDKETGEIKVASGMDDIIELDYKNDALRQAMISAMEFWITACDIDGFRCDLAFWVELDFWKEARTALEKTKTLFWLGEFDPLDNPEYYTCFDAAYTWTWMHKTEEFYKLNKPLELLTGILAKYENVCGTENIPVWFTSNHDENSWNGTEYEKYGEMCKALAVFSFTWNGMPLLYSGQELPNKKRLKFFDKDAIEWDGNYLLHEFYKILCLLKKNNPALRTTDPKAGTRILQTGADNNAIVYIRQYEQNEVLVTLNLSSSSISLQLDEEVNGAYRNVFDKKETLFIAQQTIEMQPWEYLVFEKIKSVE